MNTETNKSGRETADERLERYAKESNNAAAIMKRNRETSERLSKEMDLEVDFYEDGDSFYYKVEPKEESEPDFGYRVSVADVSTGQSHPDWGIVFPTKNSAVHYANERAKEGYRCRVSKANSRDMENWKIEMSYRNAPPALKLLRKSKELIDKSVTWIFAIVSITLFICAVVMATQEAKAFDCGCGALDNACLERCLHTPIIRHGPSIYGPNNLGDGMPRPLSEVHDDWCRADPDYYGC